MEEKNGCFSWAVLIIVAVILYLWISNVETITVVQQLPPPQDSWDVVYPKFKDDVSAQLLNTQKIAGSVLNDTAYIKTQGADLQYSVDLLLSNLGIMKKESYEESIKQRNEQRIATLLSLLVGWWLGAFVTKDKVEEIRERISQRKKKNTTNSSSTNTRGKKAEDVNASLIEHIRKESATNNPPNDLLQRLPRARQTQFTKLCPKCGVEMEIKTAPTGRNIGKQFFVCPNYSQCKQVFPLS